MGVKSIDTHFLVVYISYVPNLVRWSIFVTFSGYLEFEEIMISYSNKPVSMWILRSKFSGGKIHFPTFPACFRIPILFSLFQCEYCDQSFQYFFFCFQWYAIWQRNLWLFCETFLHRSVWKASNNLLWQLGCGVHKSSVSLQFF